MKAASQGIDLDPIGPSDLEASSSVAGNSRGAASLGAKGEEGRRWKWMSG